MILIVHPFGYAAERKYIFDTLIKDFLGIDYELMEHDQDDVRIMLASNANGRQIILPDVLFGNPEEKWMTPETLPQEPLNIIDANGLNITATLTDQKVPVIYGRKQVTGGYLNETATTLRLGLDIFGSSFFMLTRYEEMVVKERDQHERFFASESLAFREKFLSRPIVNEYLEILWWALRWLSPVLTRKEARYTVELSHGANA
ncbi:MAG: hypothetical protein HY779_05315 [Rubrobacteridae bacterium]|nr:hypothetical protein [Rubrobacteridae bacterium]